MLTVKLDVSALREFPKIVIVEVPLTSRVEQLANVVKDIQSGDNVETTDLHFWTRTGKRLQNKVLLQRTRLTDQPFLVAEVSCSKSTLSERSELLNGSSPRGLRNDAQLDRPKREDEKIQTTKSRKPSSGISESGSLKRCKKELTNKFEKTSGRKHSAKHLLKRDEDLGSPVSESTGKHATPDEETNFRKSGFKSRSLCPPVNADVVRYNGSKDSTTAGAKHAVLSHSRTSKPDVGKVFHNAGGSNPDRYSCGNAPPTILPTQSNADIVKVKQRRIESETEASTNEMSVQEASCCNGNDDSDDDIQIIHVSGEETVTNQQIVSFMTAIFQRYLEKKKPRSPSFERVMKRLREAYPQNMSGREAMVKTIYAELLKSCPKRNDGPKVESVVGSYKLTEKDFATLHDGCWLNDNIINAYLYLLAVDDPMVYTFNTFFYPTLMKNGYKSVQKWTRKENLFKYRLLLVPVHLNNHWTMAVITVKGHMIEYYDSMGSMNPACLRNLKKFMVLEAHRHQNPKWMLKTWKTSTIEGAVPRQTISGDCGVFACQFAKCMVAREPAGFHQNEMHQLRRQMSNDIHRGEVTF